MPELALELERLPPGVDWAAWAAACVSSVHTPPGSDRALVEEIAANGLRPVCSFSLCRDRGGRPAVNALGVDDPRWTVPGAQADLPDLCDVLDVHLSCARYGSHLEDRLNRRWGEAVVGELDTWAASVDLESHRPIDADEGLAAIDEIGETLRRYLRARMNGSAPVRLAANQAALRLLLEDKADALMAHRQARIEDSIQPLGAAVRARGGHLSVELDGIGCERARLAQAYANAATLVTTRISGSLTKMGDQAAEHVMLVGRRAAVSVAVPSETIDGPETLADALDLLDGIGVECAILCVDESWLSIGSATVARAAYRLTGRPGAMSGQARRVELRPA